MGLHGLTFSLGFLFGWFLRWPKQRVRQPITLHRYDGVRYSIAHPLVRQQRGDY